MNPYPKIFDEVGYLYISNLLTKEETNEALLHLFIAKENGEHIKDSMGFDTSFHDRQLNYLLEKKKPILEKILDMKLIPSYSYSRIYHKGDILPLHTDRNSCEISVTITLGYSGNSIWPFSFLSIENTKPYISFKEGTRYDGDIIKNYDRSVLENSIIEVGDGILYKGMQVAHGRDIYEEGIWQAQVFLHYIDANGKNTIYQDSCYGF